MTAFPVHFSRHVNVLHPGPWFLYRRLYPFTLRTREKGNQTCNLETVVFGEASHSWEASGPIIEVVTLTPG